MATGTRRGAPRTAVDAPRQLAFDALRLVDTDDAYLNLALARLLTARGISGRDAAFATELAAGTARLQGSYDSILATVVKGGAGALQPEVLAALRLGSHQLLSMRVAAHAAVGTSVELARAAAGERPVRLVNAVLRTVASKSLERWLAQVAPADPIGGLVVRCSHPRWIVEAFADALGDRADAELESLLRADNVAAAVTLVARPGLASVEDLLVDTAGARGRWSPYAVTLDGGYPAQLPQVRSGRVGVQDEGSQLAALVLARAAVSGRDTRWLDACAGPGGKAALLAGLAAARGATLVAAELQPHRAVLVRGALRGYAEPVPVVVADGTRAPWRPATFDRVIADVPCSGLGALRRRPEARWRRTETDVGVLAALQDRLLDAALDATRPGGVVAYVTCSPHVAETRAVVDAVLARRGDASEEDAREHLPGVPDLGPGPSVQLWPHVHGTDAMFVALLRRSDD